MKKKIAYWQPEFTDNARIVGHPEAEVYSFEVWKSKKNLLADYPKCTPIGYEAGSIEKPTIVDKKNTSRSIAQSPFSFSLVICNIVSIIIYFNFILTPV